MSNVCTVEVRAKHLADLVQPPRCRRAAGDAHAHTQTRSALTGGREIISGKLRSAQTNKIKMSRASARWTIIGDFLFSRVHV